MLGDMHIGARASDLLDGRLSPAEERQVQAHLAHCVRCAQEVHAEQQVLEALRVAGQQDTRASRELVTGLLRLSAAPPPRRPVRQPGPRTRVGLLAVGAAVTLGVAVPVAAGVGPAFTSVLAGPWGSESAPTAKIVVIPAGPRAGAHTDIRFESSHPGSAQADLPTAP